MRRLATCGVAVLLAAGCGADQARQAEIAALRAQVEEMKKSQAQTANEVGRVSGELKALDAQAAFLVGETKAAAQERAQLKTAIQEQDGAVKSLRSAIDETNQKVATLSAPPPAPTPTARTPAATGREASADKMYQTAMTSFRAEEHGQAVLEFTELIEKFPKHTLAASAQYWIGEAYYRQRDYNQALAEFQKVTEVYPQSAPVPEALLKIGMCYRALHDVPHAKETWELVVKSHPKSEAATQARTLLSSLATPGSSSRPVR
ncbi:MAG TPA: tol-pal system protein YbgF [Candidatus Bathyarchaeia archaeon]|nr:tol-pal system protein YbgF [Candidatus Bathyarchaeia archaeon]